MTKRRAGLVALATLVVAWGLLGTVLGLGAEPKLGLDLQGGFSVVLDAPDAADEEVLDRAVDVIRRRIEALGNVQEPEIAVAGTDSIIVQLPGVTDRDRALDVVGSTGELSFRPVLSIGVLPGVSPIYDEFGVTPPGLVTTTTTAPTTTTSEGETTTTTVPPPTTTTVPLAEILPPSVDPDTGLTRVDDPTQEAWLLEETSGFIYHVGPALLVGADLSGARALFSGGGLGGGSAGQWVVDPDFTSTGSRKFEESINQLAVFDLEDPRRRFAIVLDGTVVSAPRVLSGDLSASNVIITIGGLDDPQREAEDLATVLRYGALPTTFEISRVESVSATLGDDSLTAGLYAGLGGLILVGVAMTVYYRALGLITIAGLSVFGSTLLMLFSLLGEWQGLTLTLAGVAGLIVSIGITSDSYIVYFERIKEEVGKGRSLRAAVDAAFPRAFRTILTADTVSFVGAILLWLLAIGPVRGFAIALGLATIVDVFVAYYFTRPAAAFVARTRFGDGGALSIRGAVGSQAEMAT